MATKNSSVICAPTPLAQNNLPSTTVNQIYGIVNEIFQQTTGRSDLAAVDTNTLVAMGTALDNLGKKDIWLNSVARRIGLTIDGYRMYQNDFADLYRNQFEWGAIVQKLYVGMPDAQEDLTYKVGEMDGQSVDQYIINNPNVSEKFFDKETPYSFFITIQDWLMREAFLSAGGMNALFNYIFGQVNNRIEHTLENLGRYALMNLAINTVANQRIHLLTMYNSENGTNLTAGAALNDEKFLGYVIATIYKFSDMMARMSVLFNQDNHERFTPKGLQRLYILGDLNYKMGTVAKTYAFNERYLDTPLAAKPVPYWAAPKQGSNIADWATLSTAAGTNISGEETTINNLVAVLCDRDSVGTFRQEERVATTPLNARALYYNTFWHERQLWFNDMGENVVIFTLD